MSRVVIIGASVAGFTTARELRAAGYRGQVVLIGNEPHLPYDRPPLSKQVLSGQWTEERVWLCDHRQLATQAIELRLGVTAMSLDPAAHRVQLSTGDHLDYDDVVVATGGRPRVPKPWAEIDGVCVLRTLDDVRSLRSRLATAATAVIIGAGFIGSEAASVIAASPSAVVLVDPLPMPMAGAMPPQLGAIVADAHRAAGVDLRLGVAVDEIVSVDRQMAGVRLTDGSHIEAELAIVGLGSTPNVEWLHGSGVPVNDGVICDVHCQALKNVYAAGDVASWENQRFGARMRVEHRMHAAEQAAFVARMIVAGGDHNEPFAPIPFFWSDQFDLRIQAFGHIRPDDGFTVIEGSFADRRLVATCTRNQKVVGVLGVNAPRAARTARALIDNCMLRYH
jgi:NADPH-dependent 2,4-dienoyl-CoA reductase/sulfur reductase-like enzyme